MLKQACFSSIFVLAILLSFSCVSGKPDKNQVFAVSKVYPSVVCQADTSLSYALFLPPHYEKGKPCPVLILFDPHGDGLLPVNLFSAGAATGGFIIVGSNNSKNGMPTDQTTAIYRKILADLNDRFTLEKKAVYLGGFSGGSRVAGAAAITEGGVAGVVACGAGLPNTNQKPVAPFSYLAVAGIQDFNYTEMRQLDEILEGAGYKHHLLVFDGIHQWPLKEIIPEIFTWLRFDAMRNQAIAVDRAEVNSFIEKNDKTAESFAAEGKFPQQQEAYYKMLHYLQGLNDVAPIQDEISRLSDVKEVAAFHNRQKQLLEMEQDLQRKYSPEIQQQNQDWWTKETTKLRSLSEDVQTPETKPVYKRLLGYLSLNCYMYSNSSLKQGDLEAAARFIAIYRLVDPTNAEHRYMAARVSALQNDADAVFAALNEAVSLGFKDFARLKADADFKPYREDQRFKRIIDGK
jgi:dienelactone hydrolase